jgi:hypothetical protein
MPPRSTRTTKRSSPIAAQNLCHPQPFSIYLGPRQIVPYAHVAELNLCDSDALGEMMRLAQRVEKAFQTNYKPDGMNLGMNLGRAAVPASPAICIFTCCRAGSAIPTS